MWLARELLCKEVLYTNRRNAFSSWSFQLDHHGQRLKSTKPVAKGDLALITRSYRRSWP
jgi:hypothetical protein